MKHKDREHEIALSLRQQGYSLADIAANLEVAKSTVSLWVRDIELTDEQVALLNSSARHKGLRARENFSRTMQAKRQRLREQYRQQAEIEFSSLRENPQFMFGLALYIGEGSRGERSSMVFTNWNYRVIIQSIRFFLSLDIPLDRMRCRLMLHPTQSVQEAEAFWSKVTRIPLCQFGKTYAAISPGSRGARGQKWPHGGCQLFVSSIELRHKLNRWMELALEDN